MADKPGTRALLADAASRAASYLDGLQERSVAPTPEALAGLARLAPPLPEKGLAPEAVLALLDEAGSPAALEDAALAWLVDVLGLPAGTGAIR